MTILDSKARRRQAWRRAPAILLLALCSCFGTVLDEGFRRDGIIEVRVGDCAVRPFTKADRLSGCEEASSGAFIAIYRTEDGLLEDVVDVAPECFLALQGGVEYDFFLVGNLNGIRISDGRAISLHAVLGESFPQTRSELISYEYMLDGGQVAGKGWRRESAADITFLGIPYAGQRLAVTAETLITEGGLCFPDAAYLFSKVRVTVDHSLMDHGNTMAQDWFLNVSLSVRQANACLLPFSSAMSYARSSEDIIGTESDAVSSCFDYDVNMPNGTQVTYTLYVPANNQGRLLTGNMDAGKKTPAELYAAGHGEKASLCTYVEFTGAVSSVAGGFCGDVKYRFYLGADACSDFSVLPGVEYRVTLTLTVDGIFGDVWKATNSVIDFRELLLYRSWSYDSELSDDETITLNVGWNTDLYVRCDDGKGTDLLWNSSFDGPGWTPGGLDDTGLRCSFWNAADADAEWMEDCGVSARWNRSKRCLSFSVSDEALFQAHCGESRRMEIYAAPGNAGSCRTFILKLDDATTADVGGYTFTTSPVYVNSQRRIRYERESSVTDPPTAVSIIIDYAYIGDYDLDETGVIDLGVLPEGRHLIDMEVMWSDRSEWGMVCADVFAIPTVSVSFGEKTIQSACYKDVRDDDGNPYVAHRRSWGRIWVEFSPQGMWDGYDARMDASCGAIHSKSGETIDIVSTGVGRGEILLDFTLGDSTCTVSVPYLSYEEVTFRAAEEHGWLVLINNNVSVGWESLVNTMTGTLHASVRWSLNLKLWCNDNSSASGSWGPFTDTSMSVADGSRHLRSFHDEFRDLRKSFENGHSLQDATRLEGKITFRVTFGSSYYLANVTGATFADFSGMVEGECSTPSAHPLLQHWSVNSSRFYGLR